jgi:Ser/Thr protein kinase RdoA (MazF antagonist)
MTYPFDHNREPLVCHSVLSADELAKIIQANYTFTPPVECSLFYSGVNDIYLVCAQEQKYILRISHAKRYGTFEESAYRFELDLLDFLREKQVPIAYPLARRNKDMLGIIDAPEGKRHYALFHFVEGKVPSSLKEEDGYILGETLAKLHLTMNEFSSPHPRFHLDEDFLINEPIRRLRNFPQIPEEDIAFLEKLSESLKESIQGLSRQMDEYGIIHGDFWWNNVHFEDGKPTLFDFDFGGYGWRAYDIGSLRGTAKAFEYGLSDEVVDSFFKGYQSVRKLTGPELAAIAAFEKIRIIWAFGLWTASAEAHGTKWFYEMFVWFFSNLKRLVEGEESEK